MDFYRYTRIAPSSPSSRASAAAIAWRILRSRREETAALRAWTLAIATRRGKRIAIVALARRLAGIVYAMWRDNAPYTATKLRMPRSREVPKTA